MALAEADQLGPWIQVIIQGGALTLVSYIIMVLYPKIAKETREERERRDELHARTIDAINNKFDSRNDILIANIKEQTVRLEAKLDKMVCAYREYPGWPRSQSPTQ